MKTWILVHSSGFPASQWKRLSPLLDGEVIAPNLPGYGDTPWDASRPVVDADSDHIVAIARTRPGAQIVGHSYGGLVALHAAIKAPDLFEHLWLIEPIVVGLADDLATIDPDMVRAVQALADTVKNKQYEPAIRGFFDFWGGPGAFDTMPDPIRNGILGMSERLAHEIYATNTDQTRPDQVRRVPDTTLIISEGRKDFVQAIADGLLAAIPGAQQVTVAGEHMCPVTHPADVARVLRGP